MRRGRISGLIAALCLVASGAAADTLRIATFNASLVRKGPGGLLSAIEKEDRQVTAVAEIIRRIRPDILLLNEFDYDPDGVALTAFTALLAKGPAPIAYPHSFAARPNTGYQSGLDLNNDGKTTGPEDAWGYGRYPGQYAMALLSRHPIRAEAARSFTNLLWQDLPGATLPRFATGAPFPSAEAHQAMRLSSKAHWDVPVMIDGAPLHILASHPTPPVFDGPEDANGLRNRDEIRLWSLYLSGTPLTDDAGTTAAAPEAPVVVMGDLNLDPADGDGHRPAMQELLSHPRLQDPAPKSTGAVAAAASQGGQNRSHQGDPALDTADWRDDRGPGNLRVDFVLPDARLTLRAAGVFWPAPGEDGFDLIGPGRPVSSDHRLVWIDIDWP